MREQLVWKGVKHRFFRRGKREVQFVYERCTKQFGYVQGTVCLEQMQEKVWLIEAQGTVRLGEVPGTVWLVEAQGTVCLGRGARNSLSSRSTRYSLFAGRGASKRLVGRSERCSLFGRDAEQFYW